MDPTNNSTPMPNPASNPMPTPTPTPAADLSSTPNLTPASEGGLGATPNASVPGVSMPNMSAPGVVTPGASEPASPVTGASAVPAQATAASGMTTPPVNPIIQPGGAGASGAPKFNGFAATDPIMMPEPAPEPDPIEEELKAPMKAAAPVPGSIGSAMSGPSADGTTPAVGATNNPFAAGDDKRTPNVAFNDPATQPEAGVPAGANNNTKPKNNKTTLIALIVVAAIIVVVLVVVLLMQLMGGSNSSTGGVPPNDPVAVEDVDSGGGSESGDEDNTDGSGGAVIEVVKTLKCTKAIDEGEIVKHGNLVSGITTIEAGFGSNDELAKVSMRKDVIRSGEGATGEPETSESHEDVASELEFATAVVYDLPLTDNDEVILDYESIKANYEQLEFTCEVL